MRQLRSLVAAVALLALGYTAGAVHFPERLAHASYQVTTTDPAWTFDVLEIERQVANFAKTNAIGTQTAWTAFIAGLTSGQSTAVSRGLLSSVKCSIP